jgi:hypothetical protein
MRQRQLALLVSLLLFTVTNSCSQNNSPENSAILGTFVASTPCTQGTRPIPGIPVNTDCELIKWKLTLFQDETYKLHCVYGLSKQGTTGFIEGGKQVNIEGKWTISNGTAADPNAVIYRLNDDKTNRTISFLKLNDDLLHLLDSDQRLMTGNAAWSYTMNRIDHK